MSTQVVLITGGITGIGRAAAIAFAKKGSKVVVAGRRDEAGKALVRELRAFGSEAEFISLRMGAMPDSNMTARRIADGRRIVVATPAYLQRHGTPTSPGDLRL